MTEEWRGTKGFSHVRLRGREAREREDASLQKGTREGGSAIDGVEPSQAIEGWRGRSPRWREREGFAAEPRAIDTVWGRMTSARGPFGGSRETAAERNATLARRTSRGRRFFVSLSRVPPPNPSRRKAQSAAANLEREAVDPIDAQTSLRAACGPFTTHIAKYS